MALVKRLYTFILKSFVPLFAMTFFIVLFIVLMQFLWKHIDDLVGKGLPFSLIAELFFYAAVSMVPMALPLAILLASLMTYGNFGEKFELTAMKASGISLIHSMRPLIAVVTLLAIGAFFFQNYVLPPAQVKMWTLLFSMRQKSPEVEIPEGVFYDQIPGYNLLVQSKNRETGMLYDVMIYDVTRGGDNATILMADSGRMAFTGDMRYLYLHLFTGEQFENLREQKALDKNVPFRRESFADKEILIPFDANFNRLDEGGVRNQYVGKDIVELRHTIDSVNNRIDSTGIIYAKELKSTAMPLLIDRRTNRPIFVQNVKEEPGYEAIDTIGDYPPLDLDSLINSVPLSKRPQLFENALSISKRHLNDYQFKSLTVSDDKMTIRRHEIELLKKYTLSVACIIFFFIGAPLGAIIRKGGLGAPLVISVLLFLFYYIIDNAGYKMARDGRWEVWAGIWLSTFVLAPLGIYVTYKAMNDSSVFNPDSYKELINKLRGIRQPRSVARKEIVINDVSESQAYERLRELREECLRLLNLLQERKSFDSFKKDAEVGALLIKVGENLDSSIEYLTDVKDNRIVDRLSDYPWIYHTWILDPMLNKVSSFIMGKAGVLSYPVYLLSKHKRKKLEMDIERTIEITDSLMSTLFPE